MEIIVKEKEFKLDIKRCYLPGFVLLDTCPNCGASVKWRMNVNYLSYPNVNKPENLSWYHNCENSASYDPDTMADECEWKRKVKITLSIEEIEE